MVAMVTASDSSAEHYSGVMDIEEKVHKARICIWRDLNMHDLEAIEKAKTAEDLKWVLAEIFNLKDSDVDPRAAVLLELYFYTLQFCRDHRFSREQTSCFFSIVKETHQTCLETPLGNMDRCYQYFKELLLCHSTRRPPFSIDLFNQDQVMLITDYMMNTYFRHFKLYKYVFTPQVRLDISLSYAGLEEEPEESTEMDDSEERSTSIEDEDVMIVESLRVQESPTAPLKEYIKMQLNEEVSHLQSAIEEKLRETEASFSAKLAAFEEPPQSKKAGKGKHK